MTDVNQVTPLLAHVRQLPDGLWTEHLLEEHLREVARLAGNFSSAFGSEDWARLAGLWHDLGKYREAFQRYIKTVSGYDAEAHIESAGRVDHSTAGAIHAIEELGMQGRILAYLIAGHHAGLPDWNSPDGGQACLSNRIGTGKQAGYLQEALAAVPSQTILDQPRPTSLPPQGSLALWVRMMFSCLADADFLDTEAFMDGRSSELRAVYPSLAELQSAFDLHMSDKAANAINSPVNRIRADVLRQCRDKADLPSGLFSLTVPTGGGKTLSSMAFALSHAVHHGKNRVIYVIPYTSIIEQTANIFREIFGNENVIEHHSNLDPNKEDSRSRLATENWDAPIIVTTNVQFFESLFAAKTSRCRKLHNIVNSVVVLDEAQLLPPEFLAPILHVMQDLANPSYKVSFVLSTATQPAFSPRPKFAGLKDVRELMDNPGQLYTDLKRVEAELPADFNAQRTWESIADELQQHESALCIVNSRKDCRELHALMSKDTIHLSALMCGQHRSAVIADIKQRLKDGIPTRVISTQLVEAGVDMDFPVVYRALAGLDAVAQAAGRCNREGALPGMGKVVVFVPPKLAAPGQLRKAQQSGREIMRLTEGDPLTRERFEEYFRHYYAGLNSLDKERIVGLLDMHNQAEARKGEFNFRTAAEKFRLIDEEGQIAVIVQYGESDGLIASLEASQNLEPYQRRGILRRLQRYTVNIREHECKKLLASGDIGEIFPGTYVQHSDTLYHAQLGLLMSKDVVFDPAQGVV